MKNLNITVSDKVATYRKRDGFIVCGNSDYQITFTFDDEWNKHTVKTARFKCNGIYIDVEFKSNVVSVPVIHNTLEVEVGVYAGDLCTTTPAIIPCEKSILCGEGAPFEPAEGTGSCTAIGTFENLNNIDFQDGDPESVRNLSDGIWWNAQAQIECEGEEEAEYFYFPAYHRVPIVPGNNVTFEVDEENQVVKVNSVTPTVAIEKMGDEPYITIYGNKYYRVSDKTPSKDELIGSIVKGRQDTATATGKINHTVTENEISSYVGGYAINFDSQTTVYVIYDYQAYYESEERNFGANGIYFYSWENASGYSYNIESLEYNEQYVAISEFNEIIQSILSRLAVLESKI